MPSSTPASTATQSMASAAAKKPQIIVIFDYNNNFDFDSDSSSSNNGVKSVAAAQMVGQTSHLNDSITYKCVGKRDCLEIVNKFINENKIGANDKSCHIIEFTESAPNANEVAVSNIASMDANNNDFMTPERNNVRMRTGSSGRSNSATSTDLFSKYRTPPISERLVRARATINLAITPTSPKSIAFALENDDSYDYRPAIDSPRISKAIDAIIGMIQRLKLMMPCNETPPPIAIAAKPEPLIQRKPQRMPKAKPGRLELNIFQLSGQSYFEDICR